MEKPGVSLNSSELNWFDLESKCQKLVFDIIQPNIGREQKNREDIDLINKVLSQTMEKRIADLEFFILKKKKDPKSSNPTMFDEI